MMFAMGLFFTGT
jgi:hypothetical protein